jgi:hypothetical protein
MQGLTAGIDVDFAGIAPDSTTLAQYEMANNPGMGTPSNKDGQGGGLSSAGLSGEHGGAGGFGGGGHGMGH